MMVKPGYEYTLSIPQHNELGPGLLRKLIRQADLTVEVFNSLSSNSKCNTTGPGWAKVLPCKRTAIRT